MKIVFLNVKARVVEIYTEDGVKSIPFSGIQRIKDTLGSDGDILYITNAVRTNGPDVVKLVHGMNTNSLKKAIEDDEVLYVRSTGRGVIRIESLDLSFNGPDDFKPLDDILAKFGKDVLDKNLTLKKLRESGTIEIIPQHDIKSVKGYMKLEKAKKQEKIKKEQDKRDGKSKGSEPDDDMWSDKNPLALNATSLGGRSSNDNEGTIITDDMIGE